MENVAFADVTDIEKDTEIPFQEAVSGTTCAVLPDAVAVNVALVAPAATVVLAGIDRTAFPPDRATGAPPEGAACESVTVHVAEPPLATWAGVQDRPVSCEAPVRDMDDDCVTPFAEAVITADWSVLTAAAFAGKAAVLAPLGTVTLAGTVRLALLLESATGKPAAGAALLKDTVQAMVPVPVTVAGEQARPESFAEGGGGGGGGA
jgi:hypothetical protein